MSVIKIKDDTNNFIDIPTLEGAQGVPGPQGPAGQGIPTGGNENNVLVKNSPANYDTSWKSLVDLIYPIGSYYETSDTSFNPNISFGGVWEQEEDGTVLASRQTSIGGSQLGANVGSIVGEENHTLTIDEMPTHSHQLTLLNYGTDTASGVEWQSSHTAGKFAYGGDMIEPVGKGYGFDIIQPTKIICRWHRTA